MGNYFVLDDRGEPTPEHDIEKWTQWFERADRAVARTIIAPEVIVLTTFRGVDDSTAPDEPKLFESRVFGGVLDGEETLYGTREHALRGHEILAAMCREGSLPDYGISGDEIS
jgi:hypothetical protein